MDLGLANTRLFLYCYYITNFNKGGVLQMKMVDFKLLSTDEQITILNKHLLSIRDMPGRLEDNFKRGDIDFGYSMLKKSARSLGIMVDGKNYIAYKVDELPDSIVMLKQNNVKQDLTKINNTSQEVVKPQQTLTREEILFVKTLFKAQKSTVNDKQMLLVPQMTGAKKTTGISVYVDVWGRWGAFKDEYKMYSGTDLMAMALEEFMAKYRTQDEK